MVKRITPYDYGMSKVVNYKLNLKGIMEVSLVCHSILMVSNSLLGAKIRQFVSGILNIERWKKL